jgi:hypothetical protein
MKPKPAKVTVTPPVSPGSAVDPTRLAASCGSLLLDFPDPMLIADRDKKVVFLNRAAEKIFGTALQPGDPCPICSQITGLPLSGAGTVGQARCLENGESLTRAPLLLKPGWTSSTPLTVTAAPLKGPGDEPAGCLVVLR